VALARDHDFAGFAAVETRARRELGYPPYGRLAALRLSGPDGARVEQAARELFVALRDAARATGTSEVALLGPAPAPIPLIQNRHRWRIMLRAERQDRIRRLLTAVLAQLEGPPSGVRVRLDIDPVSML
jgi:primosomal protein N' (replication factor Y)